MAVPFHISQRRVALQERWEFVRVDLWQNGFFADLYFWAAGFLRGFRRRIFSPHLGKKVPRKILQENPLQNPPKFTQQKSLTLSGEGPGPKLPLPCFGWVHTKGVVQERVAPEIAKRGGGKRRGGERQSLPCRPPARKTVSDPLTWVPKESFKAKNSK